MSRPRHVRAVAASTLGFFMAAGVMLGSASAVAQTAPTDPFNPQNDPKLSPFQKFRRQNPATPLAPSPSFIRPPASGAGKTGFDSTNARNKRKAAKTKAPATAPGVVMPLPASTAIAPGIAAQPSTPNTVTVSDVAANSSAQAPPAPFAPNAIGALPTPPKKRKPKDELDPYDPLGIRAGTMLLYPAVEVMGGYDTNPGRFSGGPGASLLRVAPELQAKSDWATHELKADLRGSYTWYKPDQTPSLDRPDVTGTVNGRVDVTHQTRVDLEGRFHVGTDNPNSPNLQAGLAKLPIYTSYGGTVGLGHRFNRLDVEIKGGVDRTVYQSSSLVDGTTASNQDRNYNQYAAGLRTGYELLPGVKPFVEFDFDTRKHDLNADFEGFQRDSKGKTGLVGTTFELTRLLTGEIALGYTVRDYEDPRLLQVKGLIGNASLLWTASALTTVKFTATSNVGESTVPGVSGALYRDAGIQVDHAFRRWLIGTLKFGAGLDDYIGLDREDHRFYIGAGLTYKLNRFAQIKGEVRREWLHSNVDGVDYTANVFLIGMRLQH
ncbi:MAG TPA: outer membrane beta-barrel protein [Pseudolabrys sp.]|nr:outer membrane beta-barrel protein [Pseudolabrys sp.]